MKKADFDQLFVLVYTNSFQQEVPAELCFDIVDDLLTAEWVFHHPAANPSIVGKRQKTGIDVMEFTKDAVVFITALCFREPFAQLLFIAQDGEQKIGVDTAKQAQLVWRNGVGVKSCLDTDFLYKVVQCTICIGVMP